MTQLEERFAALAKTCAACTACGLCAGRTNTVFGTGPLTAQIMLVGEAPGQNEDRLGLPFVGRSGTLLDTYLAAIGLSRNENVYIANIVKCRPPNNRDPLPAERDACLPYLREQFKLLRPKIVVCVGRIAAQKLIRPEYSVTKEHGTFEEKQGTLFMGTFHPAALLRNPNNKAAAFEDFAALREKAANLGIL